ncbi:hypothetical protein HPP92_016198 [Vanilla planifolia]|uniref:BHLH domain-containing protein n=1 Tax=Vanilla planifolia TaxID=51239 RepID=A0A835URU4_VANPL|nr:hypothetical protein HPP92_016198 [Vanilla planifolia]
MALEAVAYPLDLLACTLNEFYRLGEGGAAVEVAEQKEETVASGEASERKKRRRSKTVKNKEQVENQRMTHIAVERNRRKQMNHYLALLRSLMPPSYVQRGDQASIIGGAINRERAGQLLIPLSGGAKGSPSTVADIEVAMVENHASLKVLSRRRPRQLLKLVTGLQNLRLTTLHLSLTTAEVVVEDDCRLNSVEEIASAAHGILEKIQKEFGV